MSFWVYLNNPDGEKFELENAHEEGGTYCLGGTQDCELNVTYNYSSHYYKHPDPDMGLRWLNNKRASGSIPRLKKAIAALGVNRDPDYWNPTAGNAGFALSILLHWAEQFPGGIFEVS